MVNYFLSCNMTQPIIKSINSFTDLEQSSNGICIKCQLDVNVSIIAKIKVDEGRLHDQIDH